MLHMSDYIKHI